MNADALYTRAMPSGDIVGEIGGLGTTHVDAIALNSTADSEQVALISRNKLYVWYVNTTEGGGTTIQAYPRVHTGVISQIVFSGDGRYLAAMSPAENLIQIWLGRENLESIVSNETVDQGGSMVAIALNADGSRLAAVTDFGLLVEGALGNTGESGGWPQPHVTRIIDGDIFDLIYGENGQIMVLGCGTAREDSFPNLTLIVPDGCESAYRANFRRDGQTYSMATAGPDAHIALYGVAPARLIKRWTDTELVIGVDVSTSGGLVAIGTGYEAHGGGGIETSLTLLKTDGDPITLVTPEDTYTCASFLSIVRGVAFSPDDRLLAVSSGDSHANGLIVEVWDVQTGAPLVTLDGHTDIILDVAFSPDGSLLATAGRDGTIRLWAVGDTPVTRDPPECPPMTG